MPYEENMTEGTATKTTNILICFNLPVEEALVAKNFLVPVLKIFIAFEFDEKSLLRIRCHNKEL